MDVEIAQESNNARPAHRRRRMRRRRGREAASFILRHVKISKRKRKREATATSKSHKEGKGKRVERTSGGEIERERKRKNGKVMEKNFIKTRKEKKTQSTHERVHFFSLPEKFFKMKPHIFFP